VKELPIAKCRLPNASRFAGDLILLAAQTQLAGGSVFNSLSPQRSAGRGDFELKTSLPRPSPPASLGGEGVRQPFRICEIQSIGDLRKKLRPFIHAAHSHNQQSPIGN